MLDKKIIDLINHQVNKELYSAYLYLSMANYYAEKNLNGFAHWFNLQAKEEYEHAEKFMDYLHDNGSEVVLDNIPAPKNEYDDPVEPLRVTVKHEEYVTSLINEIVKVAHELVDYRTINFLSWFINEQAEEEKTANDLLARYEIFVNDKRNLYLLDQELNTRK